MFLSERQRLEQSEFCSQDEKLRPVFEKLRMNRKLRCSLATILQSDICEIATICVEFFLLQFSVVGENCVIHARG